MSPPPLSITHYLINGGGDGGGGEGGGGDDDGEGHGQLHVEEEPIADGIAVLEHAVIGV